MVQDMTRTMHAKDTPHTSRSERLEARITPEQKALVRRAADLSGRSLTDFVVDTLMDQAETIIRSKQVITLTARDSEIFAQAVLNPPQPNEALRAAARRHRELIAD